MVNHDTSDVRSIATRPPGWDPSDPYDGVDVSELPEWWQRAIEEFAQYNLRPYRPPRLADGTLVPEVVEEIEVKYGGKLALLNDDVSVPHRWKVLFDGQLLGEIDRYRDPGGFSVYQISRVDLISLVEELAP